MAHDGINSGSIGGDRWVLFTSVNRWERGRAALLPLAILPQLGKEYEIVLSAKIIYKNYLRELS